MLHTRTARAATTAATLLLATTLSTPAARAVEKGTATFPEPPPDKALVYFIRAARYDQSADTLWLFADATFLGVVRDRTHTHAYVDPGRRLLWTNRYGATLEIDLAPGETRFFEVYRQFLPVNEAQARAWIKEVKNVAAPTAREIAAAGQHLRDEYDDAIAREARKRRALVSAEARPAIPPTDPAGRVRVAARTELVLELLETVSSDWSPAGSKVMFRLAEDLRLEDQLLLGRGTPVSGAITRVRPYQGRGPKDAILEIAIPSLTASDGTVMPLASPPVYAGRYGRDTVEIFDDRVLPGMMEPGRQVYYMAGERFTVKTRHDAWLRAPLASPSATPLAPPADVALDARAPAFIYFNPRGGGRLPKKMRIALPIDLRPAEVVVEMVGGVPLPGPVLPVKVVRTRKGWSCIFERWDLVRYMRPGPGQVDLPIILRGRLTDGRTFMAGTTVDFIPNTFVEEDECDA